MQHALASLLGVVQRSIRTHAMLAPGTGVLVAVSGGPDSTGLLLALTQLRRKLRVELTAAHVHHGLRGAAADLDESCAAESAAHLDVPFVRAALPADLGTGRNLEARARTLRYAALRALAAEHGCSAIATGHTLDDQAETVLMRLLRGTGGRGLGAIRPHRADGVVRPLIDCRRGAVEAVVRAAGLRYRTDQSNHDPRFLRTHVRERVLPLLAELNPSIVDACANLSAAARAEQAVLGAWADGQLRAGAAGGPLDVVWLRETDAALRSLLVRHWLLRAGVPAGVVNARHAQSVVRLAERVGGRAETNLPDGWTVSRVGGGLIVDRRPRRGRSARSGENEF